MRRQVKRPALRGAAARPGNGAWQRRALLMVGCSLLSACGIFSPHERHADALLRGVDGSAATGRAALTERVEGIQITYDIKGLKPDSSHAFAIHEGGDCGDRQAAHIGPQLNLLAAAGSATSGDVGMARRRMRIWADANGVAVGFFVLPGLTLDGVRSLVGRALVVYRSADSDDGSWHPGQEGAVLACGVISR